MQRIQKHTEKIRNASKRRYVHSIIIFYLCALQIASCTTIQGTRFSSRDETNARFLPRREKLSQSLLQSFDGSPWTRIHPALTCTREPLDKMHTHQGRGATFEVSPLVQRKGERERIFVPALWTLSLLVSTLGGEAQPYDGTDLSYHDDESYGLCSKKTWYFAQGFVSIPSSISSGVESRDVAWWTRDGQFRSLVGFLKSPRIFETGYRELIN